VSVERCKLPQRGSEPRPKTNLVRSKAVTKPLQVAIILNILSTMFYVLEETKMAMVSP